MSSTEKGRGAHTPGPWNASRFGCQVLTGDSWSSICELKGDAKWEDGRGSYEQEYEWQVQEANARLIAAAPDLLAVVEQVMALADKWGEQGPLVEAARKAYARATGESSK